MILSPWHKELCVKIRSELDTVDVGVYAKEDIMKLIVAHFIIADIEQGIHHKASPLHVVSPPAVEGGNGDGWAPVAALLAMHQLKRESFDVLYAEWRRTGHKGNIDPKRVFELDFEILNTVKQIEGIQ